MAQLPLAVQNAFKQVEGTGSSRYWAHSILAKLWSEHGLSVIPLERKRPIHRNWQTTEALEPDEAFRRWAPGGQNYDYELGVVTGNQWIVIDLDVKDGHDGIRQFRKLCRRSDADWPSTMTVRTPSGGLHLVFEAPESHNISISAGQLGDGIDVRGHGGQIVAPGSRTESGIYRVDDEAPDDPAPMPGWLLEVLNEKVRARKAEPMEEVLAEGTRDTVLASMAGSMRRRGAEPDEILAALVAINDNRCDPPKDHRDLERIAWSIGTRPFETPLTEGGTEVEVDAKELNGEIGRLEVQRQAKKFMADAESKRRREVLGGHDVFRSVMDCVADLPDPTEATIWGIPEIAGVVGWVQGEGLLIFGPTGSHKSTLAQHIAVRRCGAVTSPLFDLPVKVDEGKVGYFALDRYPQIMRSIQRMWEQGTVDNIDRIRSHFHAIDCLPLNVSPFEPAELVGWLKGQGITTVIMDSYKDLGLDPNKGEHMLALNDLMQATLRAGIEWIGLHHTRKRPRGDRKLLDTEDASGSSWVTAGVGSSIVMDKMGEDSKTRIRHSKTPSTPMPSLIVQVFRDTAAMEILTIGEEAEQLEDEPDGRQGGKFASTDDSAAAQMQEYLIAHGEGTTKQIADNITKSQESVRSAGRRLVNLGKLQLVGGIWSFTEDAASA